MSRRQRSGIYTPPVPRRSQTQSLRPRALSVSQVEPLPKPPLQFRPRLGDTSPPPSPSQSLSPAISFIAPTPTPATESETQTAAPNSVRVEHTTERAAVTSQSRSQQNHSTNMAESTLGTMKYVFIDLAFNLFLAYCLLQCVDEEAAVVGVIISIGIGLSGAAGYQFKNATYIAPVLLSLGLKTVGCVILALVTGLPLFARQEDESATTATTQKPTDNGMALPFSETITAALSAVMSVATGYTLSKVYVDYSLYARLFPRN